MKRLLVFAILLALAACDSSSTLEVTRRGSLDMGSTQFVSYLRTMDESRVFVEAVMGDGHSIADVSDPDAPVWLVQNNPAVSPRAAVFREGTGFLTGIDVIRSVEFPRSQPVQALDSIAFRADLVALAGSLLFAASGDSLCVVDASDPSGLEVLAQVALPRASDKPGVSCLAADSGRLFLGRWVTTSAHQRLYLYDVTTPAAPALLDSVVLEGSAWGAPVAARFKGDYVLFANAYGLFTAQLTDGRRRLRITDSTDILQQYLGRSGAGHAAVSAFDVTGDYALCACRCSVQVAVMDVSNPRRPQLVFSTADDSLPQGPIAGLAARGDYFYVAIESRALRVYELP